jgi:predicted enzyme related to lactoylglutathione lyase
MRVLGLVWIGTATDKFDESVAFFRDTMGLPISEDHGYNVVFRLENGDRVEVFQPDSRPHFRTGPVGEFLVDDVDDARGEMEEAGIEFLGPVGSFGPDKWSHFRGPDGNVYGLTSHSEEPPPASPPA